MIDRNHKSARNSKTRANEFVNIPIATTPPIFKMVTSKYTPDLPLISYKPPMIGRLLKIHVSAQSAALRLL